MLTGDSDLETLPFLLKRFQQRRSHVLDLPEPRRRLPMWITAALGVVAAVVVIARQYTM